MLGPAPSSVVFAVPVFTAMAHEIPYALPFVPFSHYVRPVPSTVAFVPSLGIHGPCAHEPPLQAEVAVCHGSSARDHVEELD